MPAPMTSTSTAGRPTPSREWRTPLERRLPLTRGLVDVGLPVAGYPAEWAGGRLVDRAMFGFGQLRAVVVLLGLVVPEPALARLEAAHQRMAGTRRMCAGVLGR